VNARQASSNTLITPRSDIRSLAMVDLKQGMILGKEGGFEPPSLPSPPPMIIINVLVS